MNSNLMVGRDKKKDRVTDNKESEETVKVDLRAREISTLGDPDLIT